MNVADAKELIEKGIDCLEKGWAPDAVTCFEEVLEKYGRISSVLSWLGIAKARSKQGDLRPAEQLCKEAIQHEYYNASYYRNLAEVYMIWSNKPKAMSILRHGIRITRGDDVLVKELKKLGVRRTPVIPFLGRSNPINIYCGKVRSKMSSNNVQETTYN